VGIGIFGAAAASRDNVIAGNLADGADTANIALRFGTITGTLIEDNTVTGAGGEEQWGAGIVVSFSDADILRTVVRRNRLEGNFGGSIFAGGSAEDTVIERNTIDNSFGPAIESNGDRTLIRRNAMSSTLFPGSTQFGIQINGGGEDNRVEANTIDRAAFTSIDDSGTRTVMTANLMTGQIFPSSPVTGIIAGIVVREAGNGGRIQANVVRRHSPGFAPDTGAGIHLFGDGYTVAANLVSEIDGSDGIRVEPVAAGTVLRANVSSRNGDDGIDVESPATTVTANVANDNQDLGIEAVAGVTDGGGNRASGDGDPAQCVGVRCAP
jgi:hypothetical protein